jgi:flagellar assembly factor FliW
MKIVFEKGLLGLEEYKNYEIEDVPDNDLVKILRSLDDNEISLAIISPFDVEENYEVDIPNETLDNLKITEEKEVELYTTITLNSEIEKTTTNLRAPIVINKETLLGEQIILSSEKYRIKHPIIKE